VILPFGPPARNARTGEIVFRTRPTDRPDYQSHRNELVGDARSILLGPTLGLLAAAIILAVNLLSHWWQS
jgi:hypothetical protein